MSNDGTGASAPNSEPTDFLRRWRGGPPVQVHSIAREGGRIESTTREIDDAVEWVSSRIGKLNLYFSVNPLREGANHEKKGEKADVALVTWFHVDVDPKKGADWAAERARILTALEAFSPRPTVVIDSGGGYQGFWRLKEPIDLPEGDEGAVARAEAVNRALELAFTADHCHNVDRIMRLPGTVNLPNERKRKAGRVDAPTSVV